MNLYLIYGIGGLIWLIGAAILYTKAESTGRNSSLWGVGALIGGPLAWILYAMTGDRDALGEHAPINTHEMATANALHMGYTREATRTDPDIASHADKDFADPYIDRLIAKGNLKGAKDAIQALIDTAKETHDLSMLASYEQYAQRVRRMELESVRKSAPEPIAGPPTDFVNNADLLGHQAKSDLGPGQQALI